MHLPGIAHLSGTYDAAHMARNQTVVVSPMHLYRSTHPDKLFTCVFDFSSRSPNVYL